MNNYKWTMCLLENQIPHPEFEVDLDYRPLESESFLNDKIDEHLKIQDLKRSFSVSFPNEDNGIMAILGRCISEIHFNKEKCLKTWGGELKLYNIDTAVESWSMPKIHPVTVLNNKNKITITFIYNELYYRNLNP